MGSPETSRLPFLAAFTTAICSLSSGAVAALGAQFLLLFWNSRTHLLSYRWRVLTFLIIGLYLAVDFISNRTGIQVFLQYLTFSHQTAYYRTIIFEWGMKEVWRNPLFGIGLNDWVRPAWMYSSSMDNFWLLQATTFGILGFFSLAFAILFLLGRGWDRLPPRLTRLRMGWTISMIGMIIAGFTVHFWNNLFVYFFLFSGAGAWFMAVERNETSRVSQEGI
jgi:O-antigen ligase